MPFLPRILAASFFALVTMAPASAADAPRALPVNAPVATAAFLDVVTFQFNNEGESHKIVVTSSPTMDRFDDLTDGYSFIYNPATQFYTGLEHRNYTWWEFSWPHVRSAVETSKRYEKRLQDLGNEGLSADNPAPSTNSPPASPDPSVLGNGDGSGYVWRPASEKKRIADLDCTRWTGETLSGENCDVWCYAGVLPKVTAAIAQLRAVNEPMALVPVREVVPDFIFPVYDGLLKAGVTPVQIDWGSGTEKSTFRLVEQKTRDNKAGLFNVPKLYVKTTLVTMDGMTPEQPEPGLRGNRTPPRVDHLTPNQPAIPGTPNQ
jgi:hypothetical protein